MTPADEARLALAYEAYHHDEPSEFEVSMGAHRILARMRARTPTRRRRLRPLVALGILLAGALAYAATEASRFVERSSEKTSLEAPRPPAGARQQATVRAPETRSVAVPAVVDVGQATQRGSAETRGQQDEPRAAKNPPTPRKAVVIATARARNAQASSRGDRHHATWGEVAQALDRGDEQRAERALGRMVSDESPRERAKAQLGLSQLALGHGDCATALRHARAVLANPEGDFLRPRAQKILTECRRSAPPPRPRVRD